MGVQQPYLYDLDQRDYRFPVKEFDPKAITRQSWEVKPKIPKPDGPLVSFNRHPDAHEVPTGRSSLIRPMGGTAKWWIKFSRKVQIVLRAFELVADLGLLAFMILLIKVDPIAQWVLRITPGVVAICSAYAIYHYWQAPGARPPASAAAYQMFAAFTDLAVLPLYAFGGMAIVNHGTEWMNLTGNELFTGYFVSAAYYTLIGSGGLHVVSLAISLWLGFMFRRISHMPPDMNPLEDHLTARHKRNKSSIATSYMSENSKRMSTPLEDCRRSGAPYENDLSRPPSIPFMHTRSNSGDSLASMKRDSQVNLPDRQYQVVPDNSPRNSLASVIDPRRLSKPPGPSHRGSYTEIPFKRQARTKYPAQGAPHPRAQRTATRRQPVLLVSLRLESLVNRTQERARKLREASKKAPKTSAYEAVNQRYNLADSDGEDSDQENMGNRMMGPDDVSDFEDDIILGNSMHPNPLRSNPTPSISSISSSALGPPPKPPAHGNNSTSLPRKKTPYRPNRGSALSEVSLNPRTVSGSQDITDQQQQPAGLTVRDTWQSRNRDSSIQPEEGMFYAKAYGDLKAATPPIMVGNPRQVSSGNDYDLGGGGGGKYRRNVSGKIAEEGRAGNKSGAYSRYSILNDD
ncbi:hypothetical protein PG994_013130 [Apiospora phragmitis]|uniref:Uncharacterized protein n=1 Tax=Apiospora phragmitis TaxID=2905665 RepID=A0ABR1T7S1_9PEZI